MRVLFWPRKPHSPSLEVKTEEAARNDHNLSPSRHVASNDIGPPLSLEEALVLMAQADAELDAVLTTPGLAECRTGV
jgi:hypothetical protein